MILPAVAPINVGTMVHVNIVPLTAVLPVVAVHWLAATVKVDVVAPVVTLIVFNATLATLKPVPTIINVVNVTWQLDNTNNEMLHVVAAVIDVIVGTIKKH